MITRRDFLGTSLVGTVGVGAVLAEQRSTLLSRPLTDLHTGVVDSRFVESSQFGQVLDRYGVSARPFRGDVTELWFTQLDPLWRAQRASVAGLTTYGVFFCLERMAWDHGMRVTYCARHAPRAGGEVDHALPEVAAALAADLRKARSSVWPRRVAQWVAGTPIARRAQAITASIADPRRHTSTCEGAPDVAPVLYSWVIALPQRV